MSHQWFDRKPVQYSLRLHDQDLIPLNEAVGQPLQIEFTGNIHCINCDRKIKKTFNQGYCFPCMQSLAACDICIVKPELCHYDKGTCREPSWGEEHCLIDHTIYLSNTSGLKVGITRKHQQMTRWVDQGAVQAIPLGTVSKRKNSGLIEKELSQNLADKTNWRKMLKGETEEIDLAAKRKEVLESLSNHDDFIPSSDDAVTIYYPVENYPEKIKSHNLDKTPQVDGKLDGIKGQYLILDTGVLNLRKYAGYEIGFRW